jgi:hypothetical protein
MEAGLAIQSLLSAKVKQAKARAPHGKNLRRSR